MPCYSKVPTVLLDFAVLVAAAENLGIVVIKRTPNRYTLRKGDEHIDVERAELGQKFNTVAYSGSNNWDTEIIPPLVQAYAKEQIKSFAKKNGYTLSAGSKPGELVLVSYK